MIDATRGSDAPKYIGTVVLPLLLAAGMITTPTGEATGDGTGGSGGGRAKELCPKDTLPDGRETAEGICTLKLITKDEEGVKGSAILSFKEGKVVFNPVTSEARMQRGQSMNITAGKGRQPTFIFERQGEVLKVQVTENTDMWMRELTAGGIEEEGGMEVTIQPREGEAITQNYDDLRQNPPENTTTLEKGEFDTFVLGGKQKGQDAMICSATNNNDHPLNYNYASLVLALATAGGLTLRRLRRNSRA